MIKPSRLALRRTSTHDIQADSNLHWCDNRDAPAPAQLLETANKSDGSEFNKKNSRFGQYISASSLRRANS
jgi:hypothetical protein